MFIDTRTLHEEVRPVAVTLTLPALDGVRTEGESVALTGELRRREAGFLLTGSLSTRLGLPCSRCAGVFTVPAEIEFHLVYLHEGRHAVPENAAEDLELTREDCSLAELDSEGRIDLMQLVRDQIYLWIPLKAVCGPDCRGLCARCGADLNTESCDCAHALLDPRLAPLAELKKRI